MLGKYAEGASLVQPSGVQISRNGGSCPSSSGRRWPEGPDEGAFPALTRRFAPPSPKGRGTFREQVSQIEDSLKPHQACFSPCLQWRNVRPPAQHRPPGGRSFIDTADPCRVRGSLDQFRIFVRFFGDG